MLELITRKKNECLELLTNSTLEMIGLCVEEKKVWQLSKIQ